MKGKFNILFLCTLLFGVFPLFAQQEGLVIGIRQIGQDGKSTLYLANQSLPTPLCNDSSEIIFYYKTPKGNIMVDSVSYEYTFRVGEDLVQTSLFSSFKISKTVSYHICQIFDFYQKNDATNADNAKFWIYAHYIKLADGREITNPVHLNDTILLWHTLPFENTALSDKYCTYYDRTKNIYDTTSCATRKKELINYYNEYEKRYKIMSYKIIGDKVDFYHSPGVLFFPKRRK